jgi:hypothetical protein
MQTETGNGRATVEGPMPQMTELQPAMAPTPEIRRGSYVAGAVALIGIWASIALAAIFAPDLVTGTTQDHFPLALVVGALAGLVATGYVLRAMIRGVGDATRELVYALLNIAIWTAVALVAIYVPEMVTGTDPTRLPLAAIIAPIAGAILTRIVTDVFTIERR